jgi:hypothetical protein
MWTLENINEYFKDNEDLKVVDVDFVQGNILDATVIAISKNHVVWEYCFWTDGNVDVNLMKTTMY